MATVERSGRVLIIEDDDIFSQVLARGLNQLGWDTFIASNCQAALQQCERQQPGYIVLDLKLGITSGLPLINPLLKLVPDSKILVLTGYASIATAVEAMRLGAYNYLPKPADARTIMTAMTGVTTTTQTSLPEDTMSVERLEWEHIQKNLLHHQGNISATARALNMHRRTLQRKLSKKPVRR